MLVTEYIVGRAEKGPEPNAVGKALCLVVNSVLPTDCEAGRIDLVQKLHRVDLIMEFLQDGLPVEWLNLPGLPSDVVDMLKRGETIPVVDESDKSMVTCCLRSYAEDESQVVRA